MYIIYFTSRKMDNKAELTDYKIKEPLTKSFVIFCYLTVTELLFRCLIQILFSYYFC